MLCHHSNWYSFHRVISFLSYSQGNVNGNGTPYHSVQEIMPSNEIYGHGVIPQFIDITEVTFIVEGTN